MKSVSRTVVIVCCTGIVLFGIAFLLGLFIDPSMTRETRSGVVMGWLMVFSVTTLGTFIGRHV